MANLDYLLTSGAALTVFMGLMVMLKKVLVASMLLKTLVYSLPFG